MTHKAVYEMFQRLHPLYCCEALTWYPNGRNSIKIKIIEDMIFVFTYHNAKTWSFETEKSSEDYREKLS